MGEIDVDTRKLRNIGVTTAEAYSYVEGAIASVLAAQSLVSANLKCNSSNDIDELFRKYVKKLNTLKDKIGKVTKKINQDAARIEEMERKNVSIINDTSK